MSKTPIAGKAVATAAQMTAYIKSVNAKVPQSVIDMIPLYLSEGRTEGIRGDLAFAQSCLETGNFTFKGSAVTLDQNNFCGMGVTRNGMKGNNFPTPQLGIRAQVQHLKAYANKKALVNACVDPRFKYVTRGCIPYVEILGIQENPQRNGWSAGKNYGGQILDILSRILKMPDDTPKQADNLLRKGDRGDAVKLLQHRLNLVGAILQEDGEWGPLTDTAVRNYQYKAGLTVDGIVGPLTQRKLIQDAIVSRAEELAAYLVKDKWHYKGGDYKAKATFAATKKLDKPGCSCAHFVSWVLQGVGLLPSGKVLSHSKAGYGDYSYFLSTTQKRQEANFFQHNDVDRGIITVGWTNAKRIKCIAGTDLRNIVSNHGFPTFNTVVYPEQYEVTYKCGLLPHFIIGFYYKDKFEINPYIMDIDDMSKVRKDGLPVNQEPFLRLLSNTNFKSYYNVCDCFYWQLGFLRNPL